MALTHVTTEGTLIRPGAYASYKVTQDAAGLATTGVVMLVGEAESGPDYSIEDVTESWFGPDQSALVIAKYGGGPLVDAFLNAARPSLDPAIPGAPTRIYLAKTNKGSKGVAKLKRGGADWVDVRDQSWGAALITVKVEDARVEAPATTGKFQLADARGEDKVVTIRVNGGDAQTITVAVADDANDVKAKLDGITGIEAVVDGDSLSITVTADAVGGKALEVDAPAGTFTVGGEEPSWLGTLLVSANERKARLVELKGGVENSIEAGGDIALEVGSSKATATVEIADGVLSAKVSGVEEFKVPFATFKTIKQVADFINSKAGWTAKTATTLMGNRPSLALDEGVYGASTDIVDTAGAPAARPARVKMDAAVFHLAMFEGANFVELAEEPAGGLPDNTPAPLILEGGAKGATKSSDILAAMEMLKRVTGNFIVPLFAQDSEKDKAEGLTDGDSEYRIEDILFALRNHVIESSTLKMRKNRSGIAGFKGTFKASKEMANNLASHRINLAFQDVRAMSADGTIKQFQPWMNAAIAAGLQAAAGYRAIFNKAVNVNGVLHKEFSSDDNSMVEDALLNGLLVMEKTEDGGYAYVSDQTTYGRDENFVYNSLQAVYAADTVAMTIQRKMQKAFTGESLADISASVAKSYLEAICSELVRLKLLTASDDAPLGYKNPRIRINGPVMEVTVEVKLATAVYFIPITITISQVTQSA